MAVIVLHDHFESYFPLTALGLRNLLNSTFHGFFKINLFIL